MNGFVVFCACIGFGLSVGCLICLFKAAFSIRALSAQVLNVRLYVEGLQDDVENLFAAVEPPHIER